MAEKGGAKAMLKKGTKLLTGAALTKTKASAKD